MTALIRACRCEAGTAAVEFAIISMVFISLCVGIVDFGRTLYVKNQLSFLADQATRTVLVNPRSRMPSLKQRSKQILTRAMWTIWRWLWLQKLSAAQPIA